MRLLVATAVPAERDAVLAGLPERHQVHVITVGVGPAAAAAGGAYEIARAQAAGAPYQAVLSAGVAGGLPGRAEVGAVVLASRSVAADLGAESPEGFIPIDQLGFGNPVIEAADLITCPDAVVGEILTVSTVTGGAETTAELCRRHPYAAAEAMEGFGVGTAASQAGLPFGELRAISNLVGPRDKSAWRLKEALAGLSRAVETAMKEWT
ncbi:MAG: futalosine hydrolase [Micromonosporaceae bacterium]